MKTTALAAILLFAALVQVGDAADNEPKPCTAHDCEHSYDVSPLSSDKDYVFTSHSGRNFTLNVCRSVVSELWHPDVDRPEDIGGFTRGDHGDISIGENNSTLHVRDGHPVLLLTDGSSCPHAESLRTSTAIRFICDPQAENGNPQLIAQLPPEDENACAYFIEWRTKHACPIPDRYAYWKTAIMLIVIILALILTGAALFALHKLIKRRRSSEGTLPLADDGPWYAVVTPAALAERARDLRRHLTGQDPWGHPNGREPSTSGRKGWGLGWRPSFSGSRRDRRNSGRLPRSAEEEAMMGGNGGPFSLEDEDDEDEHQTNGHAQTNGGDAGGFAEESAAWGSTRPRGMDGSGVIRL